MAIQVIEPANGVKVAKKLLESKRATQKQAFKEYEQNELIQSAVKKLKARNEHRGTPVVTQI